MAIKLKVGGDDPGTKKTTKLKVSTKPSSSEVEAANKFAKDFAIRRGLLSGESTHTGGVVPPFIEGRTGKEIVAGEVPPPIGNLSSKVPLYVKSLEWDDKSNLPYYIDEKTGDTQYVNKELFYSPRFRKAVPAPMVSALAKR